MPNVDGGHYFLTTLIPLGGEPLKRADGTVTSTAHLVRETLATLPTADQGVAGAADPALMSPFARCTRTHFVRMAIVDQPLYNGRDPGNTLVEGLRNVNLLVHQPVDHLSCAWLLFCADFDARSDETDGGLASWAGGLWTRMKPELAAIFAPCRGFDRVDDAASFTAWLRRCQVDTTMSFNDYDVSGDVPDGYTRAGLVARLAAGTLALSALAGLALWKASASPWWLSPAMPLAALLAAAWVVWLLWRRGRRPFPAAAGTDLRSILKALHVQQRFARLAADLQGADAKTVHARFALFVDEVRPDDVDAPTQAPGVIRSDGVPLPTHATVGAKRAIA